MLLIPCVGCGAQFPETDGPTPRYMESSPGCWACFGEVLAREYSDLAYWRSHRLTVDAYALHHPGQPSRQTIRSVALHALSLCAVLEGGAETGRATALLQQAANDQERLSEWLEPPASRGVLTVESVREAGDAREHARRVRRWAEATWAAWADHHPTVRRWLSETQRG